MKMKSILLIMFLLMSLSSCAGQAGTLRDTLECTSWEVNGWDCSCVRGLHQMAAEGELSPGEANFLVSQKCRKVQPQSPPQRDCKVCPICGVPGLMGPMIGAVFHYRCVMGHIWPCDR